MFVCVHAFNKPEVFCVLCFWRILYFFDTLLHKSQILIGFITFEVTVLLFGKTR